jgi:hypothetical protein
MPLNLGVSDALSAFPLHQLATVMTATINNNSVSINIRDVLPALLRFNDRRELQRYNGYTPVAPDLLADYKAGIGSNLNSLGGWNNASDNDLYQRGAFVIDGISTALDPVTGGLSSPLVAPTPIAFPGSQDIYIQFTSTEPLLLSPFIFADPKSNNQAFYGVQNMNFVFNLGDATRVWRTANYTNASTSSPLNSTFISSLSVQSLARTQLLFNFLTPHPSDLDRIGSENIPVMVC